SMSRGNCEMGLSSVEEDGLIVRAMIATHSDNNPQPDVAEHADRFGMTFAAAASGAIVGFGPRTVPGAAESKVPHGLAQGMDAGAANVNGASGAARACYGSGAGCTLGDGRVAIAVAIVAQFSHHPGGEEVASARQAQIELAV